MTFIGHRSAEGGPTMRIRSTLLALSILVSVAACAPAADPANPTAPATAQSAEVDTSSSVGGRTHVLSDSSDGGVGITVTLPASGWSGEPGGWALETGPNGFDPPDGAGIISFTVDEEFYIYRDPCKWSSTRPDAPATTVDELVAALSNQRSRNPSAPEEITVGGYPGMKIILNVSGDASFSDCDDGTFSTLGVAGEHPALWQQGPGQIDEIWIVDVDGRIALLAAGYYADTPPHAVDELHAILDSIRFEP
jgi:hypothetical protein